jgi:hypothetical protein
VKRRWKRSGNFHWQPCGAKSELTTASLRPDWRIGPRNSNWGLDLVICRIADVVVRMISGECALTERQLFQLECSNWGEPSPSPRSQRRGDPLVARHFVIDSLISRCRQPAGFPVYACHDVALAKVGRSAPASFIVDRWAHWQTSIQ